MDKSVKSTGPSTEVTFTRRQLDHLDKIFCELPGNPNSTDAQLRFNSGVRCVVNHIRGKVRES